MAKLVFKTGRRGRPLTLDTEEVLDTFYKKLPGAKASLAQFRRESSGINNPELLGTQTSLPEWLDTSIEALTRFASDDITYTMAKDIKEDLNLVKRLASRRADISTTALEKTITKQYLKDLDSAIKYGSTFSKRQYQEIKQQIERATPKQRVQFYKSKAYQDVGSFRNKRYRRIKAWAQADTGANLTYEESYAYLLNERQKRGYDDIPELRAMTNGVEVEDTELLDF